MKYETFKPAALPAEYKWLEKETHAPKVIKAALKFNGLHEIPGPQHEAIILEMGDALGGQVAEWHKNDEDPWCGVFAAFILKQAGYQPPAGFAAVRARQYAEWGKPLPEGEQAGLGDVLSFWRGSKAGTDGHVGFYIAETPSTYIVFGGNQSNQVGFTQISKERLLAARRPPFLLKPVGVRPIHIAANGKISENEA